jgi:hypothetical protein
MHTFNRALLICAVDSIVYYIICSHLNHVRTSKGAGANEDFLGLLMLSAVDLQHFPHYQQPVKISRG